MSAKSTQVTYPIGYLVTGLAGTMAIMAIIFGDVKWSYEGSPTIWEPNHLIVIMINIGISCSSFAVASCVKDRRYLYALGWSGVWVMAVIASGLTTLDRISSQKDDRVANRAAGKVTAGGKEITTRLLEQAQDKVALFCTKPSRKRGWSRSQYRNVVSDFASKCKQWQDRETRERALLNEPIDTSVGDALGYRVARVLGYVGIKIPDKEVSIIMPFALTMAIVLFGSFGTGWGFSGRVTEMEFSFEQTGRKGRDAKGIRYIKGYHGKNKEYPTITEVMNTMKVTRPVAQSMLSKAKAA